MWVVPMKLESRRALVVIRVGVLGIHDLLNLFSRYFLGASSVLGNSQGTEIVFQDKLDDIFLSLQSFLFFEGGINISNIYVRYDIMEAFE